MRLIKINSDGSFSLTRFTANIPSYAILSHTWEEDDQEVTFQDFIKSVGSSKRGWKKIKFCGKQAQKDDLFYFWVDSCCIDQSSSAEISTAVNSMFDWYQNAAKCYVYLSDVSTGVPRAESERPQARPLAFVRDKWPTKGRILQEFLQSRWFTRGWTLQELLVPESVEFFSKEGEQLGDKVSLEHEIGQITGIPILALRGDQLSHFSIEERMSWIRNRETTIEEDAVYSLFGIFDIHMPLIYGEGAVNALRRLGEEIEKSFSINQYGKPYYFI